jgi:Dullard-like phosphatase family protein
LVDVNPHDEKLQQIYQSRLALVISFFFEKYLFGSIFLQKNIMTQSTQEDSDVELSDELCLQNQFGDQTDNPETCSGDIIIFDLDECSGADVTTSAETPSTMTTMVISTDIVCPLSNVDTTTMTTTTVDENCAPTQPPTPTVTKPLLPTIQFRFQSRPLLVLDLDETLVHSYTSPVVNANLVLNILISGCNFTFFVFFRPYLKEFLEHVSQHWEVCIFTASVKEYADKLLNFLDPTRCLVHHRLSRLDCTFYQGVYVKDLSRIGRSLNKTLIIDNSPSAYQFQPQNALSITTWIDDQTDTELKKLLPLLDELSKVNDIPAHLKIKFTQPQSQICCLSFR